MRLARYAIKFCLYYTSKTLVGDEIDLILLYVRLVVSAIRSSFYYKMNELAKLNLNRLS